MDGIFKDLEAQMESDAGFRHPPSSAFRDAALRWAGHSLATYEGELLDKALGISAAMVKFCNELEKG